MARGGLGAEEYVVRAYARGDALGAAAVDERLRQHVLKDIKRRQRADLSDNSRAMGRRGPLHSPCCVPAACTASLASSCLLRA